MKTFIVIVALIVALVALTKYLFPFIRICGDSMYPTYFDDEIVVGTRLFKKHDLRVGELILYKSPADENRLVIKRIAEILIEGKDLYFYCMGDNRDHSYDSRDYGYISSKNLVCKVINQREDMNHAGSKEGWNS